MKLFSTLLAIGSLGTPEIVILGVLGLVAMGIVAMVLLMRGK
jgi:hypothetical protein